MPNSSKRTSRSRTNWDRLRTIKDSEIDRSDVPELDASFFEQAQLHLPLRKEAVSIRLDADILAWFRRQGRGYQTRINKVLRAFVEHEKASKR